MNQVKIYSNGMRITHWLSSLMIFGLLGAGWYMAGLEDSNPLQAQLFRSHQTLGICFLGLSLGRLALKLTSRQPGFSSELPTWEKNLAQGVHFLIYVVLIIMPISGMLMTLLSGYQLPFFTIDLPNPFQKSEELGHFFKETHELIAWVIVALVSLHVMGVIKAKMTHGVNLLKRML